MPDKEVKKGRAAQRRLRKVLGVLLLLVALLAVGAWGRWGTRWTVPQAAARGAGYELVAYWDGAGFPSGKFERPFGLAVAPTGDVYVTDARKRVLHLSARGEFKGEWGREGNDPGEFSNPVGLAVASDGSVFVSDYDQDRVQKFTPDGRFLLAFGRSGSGPGEFRAPAGLAVDRAGFVYVADFYHHRVQKFDASGSLQKVIGHPGRMGDGALHYPTGVHITPSGHLLVADAYNFQLQWFDTEGQTMGHLGYHLFWLWPRPTSLTKGFRVPTSAAVGRGGLIHVADSGNHRVVMLSEKAEYLAHWTIPHADPAIYSPEQIAASPDGGTVLATDLAGNRILVLRVVPPADGTASASSRV